MANDLRHDSQAWIMQSWVSFFVSLGVTSWGILHLPTDDWVKAFMGMGLLFSVGSSLTLAKTVRDQHESKRLANRIESAKTEKILRDFEGASVLKEAG